MRNIVLIHLESLNYMHYQMNKELFPTLRKWEERSLSFSKYFSTATSTMMVLSDLAFGGILQNEPCDSVADGLRKYCYQESFLDNLKKKGYQVRIVGYPDDGFGDAAGCNQRNFIGYTVKLEEVESYETYMRLLEDAVREDGLSAVWAVNYISNISYNGRMKNIDSLTGLERWKSGFLYMDQCVHDLMDILERKNLLDRTSVIFYGDHGDDLFSHGRHGGLTHAIEPYAALIHTPFWIYDSRFMPETIETLIDTTDIWRIAEQLLGLPEQKLDVKVLTMPTRKFSLARNVYAAQKNRKKTFHKAYSITDGIFLFLTGNQGMELYHIGMDTSCQHNLLDYFEFDGKALSLNNAVYEKLRFHFRSLIDERSLHQIEQAFYNLRTELMTKVKHLYEYAECPWFSMEVKFDSIHYGWEERERRQNIGINIMELGTISEREFDLYEEYLEGKKIVLYGAGKYGKYFYEKMREKVEIAAWVDSGYEHLPCILGQKIHAPGCIKNLRFDMVFIAVMSGIARWEIKNELMLIGVPTGKIF